MLTLRPYQSQALDDLYSYFTRSTGNPVVVLPTGAGKSLVIAEWCRRVFEMDFRARILVVTHVAELVSQNTQEMLSLWPDAPAGIYSAGLNKRQLHSRLLFASIQSVYKRAYQVQECDMVLVDEAHLIPARSDTMYRRFLDDLKKINPHLKIIGFTATPFRLDSGLLHKGEGALFDEIAHETNVRDLIDQGYLSRPVSYFENWQIDTAGIGTRAGDFIASQLEVPALAPEAIDNIVSRTIASGHDRRGWLVFGCTVAHCQALANELANRGVSVATIFGDTAPGERARIIADYKAQRIRCLVSMGVLTTGFNAKHVDMIVLARPTKSTGLYIQMVGRGTRLHPQKENCLAEGSLVLTDVGLIPIEDIRTSMKVWDGVEFVSHSGTVFRGEQEVITYAGLTATADHKVWTEEGWKAFGECAIEQTPILITGNGGSAIWASQGSYRGGCKEKRARCSPHLDRMPRLRTAILKRLHELDAWLRRMPSMWQSTAGTKMACHAGDFSKATLHKSERQGVRSLWWAWDKIRVLFSNGDGGLGSGKSWAEQRYGDRQDQQRWKLRAGESPLSDIERAENKYAPGRAKAKVYDIINCGPRHRFTANNLLVSNCLILDFGGNISRHGPFDEPNLPDDRKKGKGDGDPLIKYCPQCEAICAVSVLACPECGHEFPPIERKVFAAPEAAPIMAQAPEWLDVDDVSFSLHEKPGKPISFKVTYRTGLVSHNEWICLEHEGYARSKAEGWWLRHANAPIPRTCTEAMMRQREISPADQIRVKKNGKFTEIIAHRRHQSKAA